jgi:hypothetical protein
VRQRTGEKTTVPPVVGTYAALWLQQLQQLAQRSGADIAAP